MEKIIIIQHCQSEHHINNMTGGWTDTPLTELGKIQAKQIGIRLNSTIDKNEHLLYSSDLLRASQTAGIIGEHLRINVIEEVGLREINTGVAAGKTKEWAKKNRNPKLNDAFSLDYQEFQDGETWREFFLRVSTCMEKIIQNETKNLIIVTHGGTLAYIIAWWMKFKTEMLETSYFAASPGSISILFKNKYNQRALKLLNDTSHLQQLEDES